MNHAEVVAEDERKKRPQNFEAKRKRLEWDQEQSEKKKVKTHFISTYLHLS